MGRWGKCVSLLVVALAAGLFAAAPAALAAIPSVPPPPTSCEPSLITLLEGRQSPPAELSGSLEEAITAKYAVLRRPAAPGDLIPALSGAGDEVQGELASYYPSEVRLLRTLPNGARYFLVSGFPVAQTVPPARCLPPPLRHKRAQLVEEQSKRALQPVDCIVDVGARSTPLNGLCVPFAKAEDSVRAFLAGTLAEEALPELVPDGVASVRISYARAPQATVPVLENTYFVKAPTEQLLRERRATLRLISTVLKKKKPTPAAIRRIQKALQRAIEESVPRKIEWLSSSGAVLHTANRPHGAASEEIEGSFTGVVSRG
jgi:hypothetical protein